MRNSSSFWNVTGVAIALVALLVVATLGLGTVIHGEAARQASAEVQQQYPHLPWQEMIGMRNIVNHETFGVDLEVIWRTVHEDLPQLRVALGEILDALA